MNCSEHQKELLNSIIDIITTLKQRDIDNNLLEEVIMENLYYMSFKDVEKEEMMKIIKSVIKLVRKNPQIEENEQRDLFTNKKQ